MSRVSQPLYTLSSYGIFTSITSLWPSDFVLMSSGVVRSSQTKALQLIDRWYKRSGTFPRAYWRCRRAPVAILGCFRLECNHSPSYKQGQCSGSFFVLCCGDVQTSLQERPKCLRWTSSMTCHLAQGCATRKPAKKSVVFSLEMRGRHQMSERKRWQVCHFILQNWEIGGRKYVTTTLLQPATTKISVRLVSAVEVNANALQLAVEVKSSKQREKK